jgi:uncharacterized protein (DUF433 family)
MSRAGLDVQAEAPPLHEDTDGVVRVGNSRVLLELVVRAFEDGATPEAIVQRYQTLRLSDVYAVISYYLRHPAEVAAYLALRESAAGDIRRLIQNHQPDITGIRARLAGKRRTQE